MDEGSVGGGQEASATSQLHLSTQSNLSTDQVPAEYYNHVFPFQSEICHVTELNESTTTFLLLLKWRQMLSSDLGTVS